MPFLKEMEISLSNPEPLRLAAAPSSLWAEKEKQKNNEEKENEEEPLRLAAAPSSLGKEKEK